MITLSWKSTSLSVITSYSIHYTKLYELWTKGETSGNTLDVVRLRADCDRDTVLATVRPHGPTSYNFV